MGAITTGIWHTLQNCRRVRAHSGCFVRLLTLIENLCFLAKVIKQNWLFLEIRINRAHFLYNERTQQDN